MFTKQDALTFLFGLLAAVGAEVGPNLREPETIDFADRAFWAGLAIGIGTAALRYAFTRLPDLMAKLRPAS